MDPSNSWRKIEDDPFEWRNDRLTLQKSFPTLLDISLFKVTLEIWNSSVSRTTADIESDPYNFRSSYFLLEQNVFKESKELLTNLKIPRSIEQMITNRLCMIRDQTTQWIPYIGFEIFSGILNRYCIQYVDLKWLLWHSDGKIDHEKTVSNMLSTAELSDIQKFIVVCKFCRIDKMKTISLNSLPLDFIESITFDTDSLVFYWICYLRNELDKIPLAGFTSVDALMARQCDSIVPFKYFWDRLSSNDQIIEVMNIIDEPGCRGYVLLRKFLPKMTKFQQYQIFCKKSYHIMKNVWICWRRPEIAVSIWLQIKDQCTGDQFVKLVQYILHSTLITSDENMRLFVDLWNATPDHLKRHVTQEIVLKAFQRCGNKSPSSFKFLYEFLSLFNAFEKKTAMRTISDELCAQFTHSILMADVIKLCYPIDDERAQFLESVLNLQSSREHALYLMNDEKFDILSQMLKIASPNVNANRKFVGGLLEFTKKCIWKRFPISTGLGTITIENKKWKFVVNHSKWRELCKFIDETCTSDDDPFWVSNMKKQFVMSFAADQGFFWHINNLNELTKVLEEVFTPEEAEYFRKTLVYTFKNEIITKFEYWNNYKERSFREFVSWCLSDSSMIEEFKMGLARDTILDSIFDSTWNFLRRGMSSECFEVLNKCLRFFCSVNEAKKYKIRKIYELENKILLDKIFKPKMRKILKLVLRHVFDYNIKEMEKWRLSKQKNGPYYKKNDEDDYDYNDVDNLDDYNDDADNEGDDE